MGERPRFWRRSVAAGEASPTLRSDPRPPPAPRVHYRATGGRAIHVFVRRVDRSDNFVANRVFGTPVPSRSWSHLPALRQAAARPGEPKAMPGDAVEPVATQKAGVPGNIRNRDR